MLERQASEWAAVDALRELVNGRDALANMIVSSGPTATPFAELRAISLNESAEQPFLEGARNSVLSIDRLRRFTAGYVPSAGEALVIQVNQFAELDALAERLVNIDRLEGFDGSEDFVQHFRAFATHVYRDGQAAVFVRRSSAAKELARSRFVPLAFSHGTFTRVEDRIFLFDDSVDFIIWQDTILVLNLASLNQLVPTFEVVVAEVRTTLRRVSPFLTNGTEFSTAVLGQAQMRSKMMQIAARPYLDRLTIDDLKRQIARRQLAIDVQRGDDGTERLVFRDGRDTRWLILKLLDDDYLDSEMTHERYEVNSKAPN